LKPLIDYAKQKIPFSNFSTSVLFLKATGGMRLLEPSKQQEILYNVRLYLSNSSNSPFYFRTDWASVISGIQEGIFGWITVNYLLKNLEKQSGVTVGALDLGGASMQITFLSSLQTENSINITFSSQLSFNLYTYSFLNYGLEESQERLNNLLYSQQKLSYINNPCFPSGYKDSLVNGTGNYIMCSESIIQLLNLSVSCQNCSINGIYIPNIPSNMKFYAFSGFFYVYQFFNLASDDPLSSLENATKQFCQLNWETITHDYLNKTEFLNSMCFRGTYVYLLLVNGFKFDPNKKNIEFLFNMNDTEISWTLGAMLLESDQLSFDYCRFFTDFRECYKYLKCGWCKSTSQCMTGDLRGDSENKCQFNNWIYKGFDSDMDNSISFAKILMIVMSVIFALIIVIFGVYFIFRIYLRREEQGKYELSELTSESVSPLMIE